MNDIDPNDSSEKHRTKRKIYRNECSIDTKRHELMKRAMFKEAQLDLPMSVKLSRNAHVE